MAVAHDPRHTRFPAEEDHTSSPRHRAAGGGPRAVVVHPVAAAHGGDHARARLTPAGLPRHHTAAPAPPHHRLVGPPAARQQRPRHHGMIWRRAATPLPASLLFPLCVSPPAPQALTPTAVPPPEWTMTAAPSRRGGHRERGAAVTPPGADGKRGWSDTLSYPSLFVLPFPTSPSSPPPPTPTAATEVTLGGGGRGWEGGRRAAAALFSAAGSWLGGHCRVPPLVLAHPRLAGGGPRRRPG